MIRVDFLKAACCLPFVWLTTSTLETYPQEPGGKFHTTRWSAPNKRGNYPYERTSPTGLRFWGEERPDNTPDVVIDFFAGKKTDLLTRREFA